MKLKGISSDSLTLHFMLRNEFLFQTYLTPSNSNNNSNNNASQRQGQMMTVIDVKGVSVRDITTDVISFIKQSTEIMDSYYPGKAYV